MILYLFIELIFTDKENKEISHRNFETQGL